MKFQPNQHTLRNPLSKQLINSPSLYVVKTDMEGYYTFTNPCFRKRFGFLLKEAEQLHFSETVHPDDVEACNQAVITCVESRGTVEIKVRKPETNGLLYWSHWDFSVNFTPQGEPIEVVCIGYDITNEEQQALDIEALNEKLAKQLSVLQSIAQTQSHEVRGPLARILGLVNLLKQDTDDLDLLLMKVQEEAQSLDGVIRQIVKQTYRA